MVNPQSSLFEERLNMHCASIGFSDGISQGSSWGDRSVGDNSQFRGIQGLHANCDLAKYIATLGTHSITGKFHGQNHPTVRQQLLRTGELRLIDVRFNQSNMHVLATVATLDPISG
jgi:hypothetical protein